MKIAYVFATNMATTFKLSTMILPQLEQNIHGVEVVGMMFFDDNIFATGRTNEGIDNYFYEDISSIFAYLLITHA